MTSVDSRRLVIEIFRAALGSVDSYDLVKQLVDELSGAFHKRECRRLVVAGFGKAACPMAKALEDYLSHIIDAGVVITKYGHCKECLLKKISVYEAGHPLPDESGVEGTQEVINLLQGADENVFVVCLISGGGSALLVSPHEGISLSDKQVMTDLLLKAGADINELNTVRKHLSRVKGGRLAEIAYPAEIISLIISDVIEDRLDVIASGPTSPDETTYDEALLVLEKYELSGEVPENVMKVLRRGAAGLIPETPKVGNKAFINVENLIVGSNKKALDAAKQKADMAGLKGEIITSELTGEASTAGRWLAGKAIDIKKTGRANLPCCLISGGETTVTVKGKGLGGRNMELALSFAVEIEGIQGITLLSAGTDGTDGPTDAAGAIVDSGTVLKARSLGLNPQDYLENNDSYHFFQAMDDLFITGPTGTNVMDIQVVVIE